MPSFSAYRLTGRSGWLLFLILWLAGWGLTGFAPTAGAEQAAPASSSPSDSKSVRKTPLLSDLPLLFVPNQGQWEAPIAYLARAKGADAFFTSEEAIIHVHGGDPSSSVVRLRPLVPESGMDLTPGRTLHTRMSYFVGNDPGRWRAGIPAHDSLRYRAIYPGIDLVFRSDGAQLVYDLELAPGADPAQVRLAVSGIEALTVDEAGNLVMTLPDGRELRQQAPYIYQEVAGERVRIDGGFRILDSRPDQDTHVFGFQVARHDPSLALVIDPTLAYSTFHGGSADDEVKALAVTDAGEPVVVGSTLSAVTTLPVPPTSFPATALGRREGLVYQVSADGSTLDYVVTIGGSLDDQVNAVTLSGTDVYLTGQTLSTDFPTGLGTDPALYRVLPGGRAQAAFVAKLDVSTPATPALDFATYFGGTGTDSGLAIALDDPNADGTPDNLYVAGDTTSADLPTRAALYPSFPSSSTTSSSLFLLKLSPDGQTLRSSTYFGGSSVDNLKAMHVTDVGAVYLAGITKSLNLPIKNPYQASNGTGTDGFVVHLAPGGEELVFSTYLGGRGTDTLTAMTLDQFSNILLTGHTNSTDFPLHNALYSSLAGSYDTFVVKLDHSGRFVHFSTLIGGLADDFAKAIAVGQADDVDTGLRYIYIGGETQSNDFPIENPYQRDYTGETDGFIVKLDPFGQRIVYSSFFGGTEEDAVLALGVMPTAGMRAVYLAGNTYAADPMESLFPISTGAAQATAGGRLDNFVALIDDTLYDSSIPGLALSSIEDLYPEAEVIEDPVDDEPDDPTSTVDAPAVDGDIAWIDLTLINPAATGKEISAVSTLVHYDPEELRFVEVDWDPDSALASATTQDVDVPELGELTLLLYQDANPPTAIGDGVRLATLKFAIRNIGDVAENPPRPSKHVRLSQTQTTALNLSNQDVSIEGWSSDIMITRPCNTLTGDCDCSGAVQLGEVQGGSQELLTPTVDAGGGPATPRCMRVNGTKSPMDATDMQRIVNNHIYRVVEATTSAAAPRNSATDADGAARIPWADTAEPAAAAPSATLSFGEPAAAGGIITTDLLLDDGGQAIAAVTIDLRYDPEDFSALTVSLGEAARAAGKSLSSNIVSPGWMRILVYGLNDTAIGDGVLGALSLTPAIDLAQDSTVLEQTPTASSPGATPVPIEGDTLVLGQGDPETFSLNVMMRGAGSGRVTGEDIDCSADCTETFAGSTTVTLNANPETGSVFSGWQGDCSGTGACTLTMTEARTVTAGFDVAAPGSEHDDVIWIRNTSPAILNARAGDDRYVLAPDALDGGQRLLISDSQGNNILQLLPGLTIRKSEVAPTAVRLTLTNGARLGVAGADDFRFAVGVSDTDGYDESTLDFDTFVTEILGVSRPVSGIVVGDPVTIVAP